MYVIIKHVKTVSNKRLPVILLNSDTEVWEFETPEEAEEMKNIFKKCDVLFGINILIYNFH